MNTPRDMQGGLRLPRVAIALTASASALALMVGPAVIAASAGNQQVQTKTFNGVTRPLANNSSTASTASSVPGNCAAILSHAQSGGATKTFEAAVAQGGSTTYFFQITSTHTDGTQSSLEDCAYANSDPNNIKYAAQADNPPFQGTAVFTSITVTSTDSICDRVLVKGTDASGKKYSEYTNLVGSSNGKADPSACQPPPQFPEAPSASLIALAGLGAAGAAALVWRRRRDPGALSTPV